MANIISKVLIHTKARDEFITFLKLSKNEQQLGNFLKAADSLTYGKIFEFMNTFGITPLVAIHTMYLFVDKRGKSRFSYITEGKINVAYFKKIDKETTYENKMNHLIKEFFRMLNRNLLD